MKQSDIIMFYVNNFIKINALPYQNRIKYDSNSRFRSRKKILRRLPEFSDNSSTKFVPVMNKVNIDIDSGF